jgi:hypothetical protein
MRADDEVNITEIELLPDGRICVFGLSAEVLAVLDSLSDGRDNELRARLSSLTRQATDSADSTERRASLPDDVT